MHGIYETVDGRPALRFERRLAHPIDVVWRAVTEPSELAHWFPARVEIDHRPGGAISFVFADDEAPPSDGEVIEFEPPRRFAFTWGDAELRFELEPDASGCRLVFVYLFDEREAAARDSAGWHVCLDLLERWLAGESPEAPDSEATEEWRTHYEEYRRRGFPSGAPVPE